MHRVIGITQSSIRAWKFEAGVEPMRQAFEWLCVTTNYVSRSSDGRCFMLIDQLIRPAGWNGRAFERFHGGEQYQVDTKRKTWLYFGLRWSAQSTAFTVRVCGLLFALYDLRSMDVPHKTVPGTIGEKLLARQDHTCGKLQRLASTRYTLSVRIFSSSIWSLKPELTPGGPNYPRPLGPWWRVLLGR
jgi:hypothetical protein